MSAEKKYGESNQVADGPVDPRSLLILTAQIRNRLRFQQLMGVETYPLSPDLFRPLPKKKAGIVEKEIKKNTPGRLPSSRPMPGLEESGASSARNLAGVQGDVAACRLCALADSRQGVVCGNGGQNVRLMIVGDYSRQEDGFSDAAVFGAAEDTMVRNMIRAIGLRQEEVYVTNVVKCCPSGGRQPDETSLRLCLPYLQREIDIVRPQVICAMGDAAAQALLRTSEPVVRLRGAFHPYPYSGESRAPIQVAVTFHPRFLLQEEKMKRAAWQDLQMVQRYLQP